MAESDKAAFQRYWATILRAGRASTREELLTSVDLSVEALDEGALATMRLLADGAIHMENAFTTLDCAKGLATKHLSIRAAAKRAGRTFDVILSRPDPGHVSHYIKTRGRRTAIVAFHFVGRTRLAILLATNAETGSGIRGFGGVYYDCIWLDGLRDEFAGALEEYARSVSDGAPNFDLVRIVFEFLSSSIFLLLSKPRPEEVIFIPHRLLHVLPLHAVSYQRGSERIYLQDMVRSIHYASSFDLLANSGISFHEERTLQARHPRFLAVLDVAAGLPGVRIEQECVEVYRQQLEPQGVAVDVVTSDADLPATQRDYIWVNWSSHAKSSANSWGDSFLVLGDRRIKASKVADEWQFDLAPTVVLAACETGIDMSGAVRSDEYCGLDVAFRIAGARAVIASIWPVEDMVATLTALLLPAWRFQGGLQPAESVTALQRALRGGTWKQFLLREEQLRELPSEMASTIRSVQEPFHGLRDDAFEDESSWAPLRAHGN